MQENVNVKKGKKMLHKHNQELLYFAFSSPELPYNIKKIHSE
jgi:hypothetical protein